MCENVSILNHISNKTDIHSDKSYEYNLKIFISHSGILNIDDNVKYLEKKKVVYCHNLLSAFITNILDSTF